jgi:RimJ/RimL family protein N-acetyltransferase
MLPLEPNFSFISKSGLKVELRGLKSTDAMELTRALQDQSVFEYINSIPNPYTIKDAEEYIEFSISQQIKGNVFNLAICVDEKVQGMMGIYIQDQKIGEFGYWLNSKFRNQGIVSHGAKFVLKHAFTALKLKKIQIKIISENNASLRIMEKLGIPQVYYREKEILYRDRHWDVVGFEITDKNFTDIAKNW